MAGQKNRNRGPRPHTWCTGPDPVTHAQYRAWVQARAQAEYRGEGWELEFDQYQAAWGPCWDQKGRTRDSMCLTRNDYLLPWSADNILLVSRQQHAQRQASARRRDRAGKLIKDAQ